MAIPPIKIINTHSMYSQCNAQAAGMDEQDEEKRNRLERVVSARRVARASVFEKMIFCMCLEPRNTERTTSQRFTHPHRKFQTNIAREPSGEKESDYN